jgi:hypothetical protein
VRPVVALVELVVLPVGLSAVEGVAEEEVEEEARLSVWCVGGCGFKRRCESVHCQPGPGNDCRWPTRPA